MPTKSLGTDGVNHCGIYWAGAHRHYHRGAGTTTVSYLVRMCARVCVFFNSYFRFFFRLSEKSFVDLVAAVVVVVVVVIVAVAVVAVRVDDVYEVR